MISPCVPLVFRNHAKLLLEPWCFTPAKVRRMTQEQVLELYLKPSKRISDLMKKEQGDGREVSGGSNPFEGVTTYDHFKAVMCTVFHDPERTEEQLQASWKRFNGE